MSDDTQPANSPEQDPNEFQAVDCSVGADYTNNKVFIQFPKPVNWIGLNPEETEQLINLLAVRLLDIRSRINPLPTFTIPLLKADTPNDVGYVIPLKVAQKIVDDFNKVPRNLLMGELNPAGEMKISLQRVSHIVDEMKLEGDFIYIIIRPLLTPSGAELVRLLQENKINFFLRGNGMVHFEEKLIIAQEDYQLLTIDAREK